MAAHRIVQIIPTLDRSGAEKQLLLLSLGLRQRGYDVDVCVLTRTGPLEQEFKQQGIVPTIIGKRSKVDPLAWLRLKKYLRNLQPDAVHTWLFAANSYGRSAAISAGIPRIIASERCVDPWKRWHEFAIDRKLARRTDAVIVNSLGTRDFYVRHGIAPSKFRVIFNGISPPPEPTLEKKDLLRELGLPHDARLIAAIGRLWPQKRMKDLIWAADLLKVVRDDLHLLIIGDGPQRDLLEQFRDQVRIRDKVHFLGHRSDVPRLLPCMEMLWIASEFEGLPNVVMEAMAAGLPVVATDIPGNNELVVPGETGFLVPLGDRAGFARGTLRILENPAKQIEMGRAGQNRVLKEFSTEKMVDAHCQLYQELLGK